MLDKRLVRNRVRILWDTEQVLYDLSKQPSPEDLTHSEQLELEEYDKWLGNVCDRLDEIASKGEELLKLMEMTKEIVTLSQEFNLEYLQLQNKVSHENRQFTMVSNIMKNKHDTARNSINNIR
jgi:hypothetical protein